MATKQQAIKALARVGATIDERHSGGRDLTVDAPEGFVFSGCGLHCFVVGGESEIDARMPEVWQSVVDETALGIEKCADTDCDICP